MSVAQVIHAQFPRRPSLYFGPTQVIPMCPKRRPILCVSHSDTGREYWTGFLDNAGDDLLSSLHTCINLVETGDCEYGPDCTCEPAYMGSVFSGTEADLEAATESNWKHPSHILADRCKELNLGDYL